ncbi:MAG: ABC transporter ATP-binding protein [Elusimicrobiota bacterium]
MAEPPFLETLNLRRSYTEGEKSSVEVLKGVDFQARAGEFVVILGPSGSGKSTLLNLLGLMDRPTDGEVRLFGQPTGRLSERDRARLRNRSLGFVFQFDSLLPEFTVLENVMLPGRIALRKGEGLAALEARALDLLDRLGIRPLAGRLPPQLSGGERQRAAIARALVNKPAMVLADEPTGNLDRRNGELVSSKLRELVDTLKVCVLMVTHNEHAVRFASRSIHLLDGRIQEAAP